MDNGGEAFMTQYRGIRLNDNQWHTIVVEKRGKFIALTVDDEPPETSRCYCETSDESSDTEPLLYIGGLPKKSIVLVLT